MLRTMFILTFHIIFKIPCMDFNTGEHSWDKIWNNEQKIDKKTTTQFCKEKGISRCHTDYIDTFIIPHLFPKFS